MAETHRLFLNSKCCRYRPGLYLTSTHTCIDPSRKNCLNKCLFKKKLLFSSAWVVWCHFAYFCKQKMVSHFILRNFREPRKQRLACLQAILFTDKQDRDRSIFISEFILKHPQKNRRHRGRVPRSNFFLKKNLGSCITFAKTFMLLWNYL